MKTRRLCAVIAAAATLLGGMAFGTAGAYAAGSASIEVRHSQKGHTYSAYKFASLMVDGDAVQVDTDADWVTAVTDAVAAANNNMDPVVSMPSEYDSNPAAFAATKTGDNDAAWFRTFAASLAVGDGVVADKTVAGNGGTAAIGSLEEGWYLITDVDKDGGRGTNAIVATTLNGVAATFKVKGDPATGQGKINAVGMFVAKNENEPDQPGKTADTITTTEGVSIGQTVAYTITLDIPNAAEGYDKYPYFVKDVASKGLTVNKDFKAVVRAADGTETNMPFTYVTVPTVGADGKTTTVLEFDLANKSGQLVITYTAVVNKDIIDMGNKVTNKAAVSRDTEVWNTPVEFDSYTGGLLLPQVRCRKRCQWSRRSEVPRVRGNRGFADPAQVHQDCGWRIPPCRSERERRCRGCGNHHRRRENHGLEVRQVHAEGNRIRERLCEELCADLHRRTSCEPGNRQVDLQAGRRQQPRSGKQA